MVMEGAAVGIAADLMAMLQSKLDCIKTFCAFKDKCMSITCPCGRLDINDSTIALYKYTGIILIIT